MRGCDEQDQPVRTWRFGDVMNPGQAWELVRGIEVRVASVFEHYDRLGDDCDFVTLAGDWPYIYSVDAEVGMLRGRYAVDDLIGRRFDATEDGGWWQPNTATLGVHRPPAG